MLVDASKQPPRHRPEARLDSGPHVLPAGRGEGLVDGGADDVERDEEREEHDEHEDVVHHADVDALLLEEADLHHEHEEERGEGAELVCGHEQEDPLRVEGRAAHEQDEEEAADEHLREELRVAPLADEGGHGHEARLARHLEQLVEPERRLVLAAREADARLVPREYRVVLVPLLGRRREVGAQREVQPGQG